MFWGQILVILEICNRCFFLIHLLDVGFGTTICPGSKRLVITVYFDGEVHPQTWGWIADKNG